VIEEILFERRGDVAWITFARPQARNAFTRAMYTRLAELCRELEGDGALRAVVLQGSGTEAFVAGSDISGFTGFTTLEQAIAYEDHVEAAIGALERLPTPTIALLRGAVTGSGAAIALVCDLRVAADNVKIGIPIARTLGNTLSLRNVARVVDMLGPALAKELLLTGRLVEAEEALRRGMVTEVAPLDEAEARAEHLARGLAANAPLTLRAAKLAILRVLEARRASAGSGEDLVGMTYLSEDFREGVRAFLEKRRPRWTGR
jgi:enoyl-CoA hydratase